MPVPDKLEPTTQNTNDSTTTTTPIGGTDGSGTNGNTSGSGTNGSGTDGSTSGSGTGSSMSGSGTNGGTGGSGTGSGSAIGDNSGGTSGGDTTAPQAAVASIDIDAGLSGVQTSADALGKDVADVSIGLGALDVDALNPVLALVDGLTGSDDGTSMSSASSAPLLAAAVNADMSGVQAAADVLGHDTADASIGLGAVNSVLDLADSQLGPVDTASGLADGLLCDIV